MPILANAILTQVRTAGGTDQAAGEQDGQVLWAGESPAYYRQNARAISTPAGPGVLATRILYVDRDLPIDPAIDNVVTFVSLRTRLQLQARILEVVGTEAPPGLPASIDTVKLMLQDVR